MENQHTIVIIGCGAGGGTAAQFARKTNRKAEIIIFEKESYPQYSKCGLPYVLSGDIQKFSDLIEFSEEWFVKENIILRLKTEVTNIDIVKKIVLVRTKKGTIKQPYDTLILATGGIPLLPPIKGIQRDNQLINGVNVLRTINDGTYIQNQVAKGKKVTIVGAGLIGLEAADALYKKGLKVTIVEALPTILARNLDPDLISPIQEQIEKHTTLYTNHLVTEAQSKNNQIQSLTILNQETKEQHMIPTDLLIIATGIKPDVTLAQSIGCKIGPIGGIQVNSKSETSIKDVYALGDCTEYVDFITNNPTLVGLGSIVVRQGIAAGINAAGGTYTLHKGLLQTWTSHIFSVEIAGVGPLNPQNGKHIVNGKFTGSSLPDYYPGGKPITIKIKADQQTKQILSAQAVGQNAALRINTLACAILKHCTIDEFRKLETAYAPPIAPTLDPLTLAGDVAALKLQRKIRSQ